MFDGTIGTELVHWVGGGLLLAVAGMIASYVQQQIDRVRISNLEKRLDEVNARLEKEIEDNHEGIKKWLDGLREEVKALSISFARWEGKQDRKYTDE